MTSGKMHANEPDIDTDLVRRLLAGQFPQWAELPIEPFPSSGTVNAVYRLGDELSVRLPRVKAGVKDAVSERQWLPRLAPHLPVAIPTVLETGEPAAGYPWNWTVCRWLAGDNPVVNDLPHPDLLVEDLAAFITALRRIDPAGAPPAYRGGSLAALDTSTRAAIDELHGFIDTPAATRVWNATLKAPGWSGPPVWSHSDLMPGNLLVEQGRLSAVIDFGCMGVGDPACDLMPAWNLLPAPARPAFRAALGADDAMWVRGRGWALSMALIALPYYHRTNPGITANARHIIHEVLTEAQQEASEID
ncbi:MAG TPA: aminoglycoside phosphotransferase family protein [Nonomuraea sp.]|nr:aminoglycoside phosphotransferase family protein [Nonomuraea sp.]